MLRHLSVGESQYTPTPIDGKFRPRPVCSLVRSRNRLPQTVETIRLPWLASDMGTQIYPSIAGCLALTREKASTGDPVMHPIPRTAATDPKSGELMSVWG